MMNVMHVNVAISKFLESLNRAFINLITCSKFPTRKSDSREHFVNLFPSLRGTNSIDTTEQFTLLIRRTFFACVYHVSIKRGLRRMRKRPRMRRRSRNGEHKHCDMRDIDDLFMSLSSLYFFLPHFSVSRS
jgi:hypothetical protein